MIIRAASSSFLLCQSTCVDRVPQSQQPEQLTRMKKSILSEPFGTSEKHAMAARQILCQKATNPNGKSTYSATLLALTGVPIMIWPKSRWPVQQCFYLSSMNTGRLWLPIFRTTRVVHCESNKSLETNVKSHIEHIFGHSCWWHQSRTLKGRPPHAFCSMIASIWMDLVAFKWSSTT